VDEYPISIVLFGHVIRHVVVVMVIIHVRTLGNDLCQHRQDGRIIVLLPRFRALNDTKNNQTKHQNEPKDNDHGITEKHDPEMPNESNPMIFSLSYCDLLQHIAGGLMRQMPENVRAADKLKLHLAHAGKTQSFPARCPNPHTCGLHRKRLNLCCKAAR
jgi:hypothetical protein